MKERRKYKRVRFGIEFVYKEMGVKGEVDLTSVDLGGGGLRLYLEKKMRVGTLVELGLLLPQDKQLFFSLGRIVWQTKVPEKAAVEGRSYLTGIEFLNLDVSNRTRVIHFVHQKLQEGKNAV